MATVLTCLPTGTTRRDSPIVDAIACMDNGPGHIGAAPTTVLGDLRGAVATEAAGLRALASRF
jgi:hypothetical protein